MPTGGSDGDDWVELRQRIFRFTRAYGVGRADADDITQQVLEYLVLHPSAGGAAQRRPEPYVRRMCLNAIRSEHRVRMRRSRREQAYTAEPGTHDTPENQLAEKEKGEQCFVALSMMVEALPFSVVSSFVLCDLLSLPAPFVATMVGRPEGTVRTWLRSARSWLRRALDQAGTTRYRPKLEAASGERAGGRGVELLPAGAAPSGSPL